MLIVCTTRCFICVYCGVYWQDVSEMLNPSANNLWNCEISNVFENPGFVISHIQLCDVTKCRTLILILQYIKRHHLNGVKDPIEGSRPGYSRLLPIFYLKLLRAGKQTINACKNFCLILMIYVPVNGNGHVGTLSQFYGTFSQH